MLIDTHCHIDLYSDPAAVASECERLGITTIAVTNLPSHFQMGLPHIRQFRRLRIALGLHPLYARQHREERPLFKALLSETSYIGEVGLDFSRDAGDTRDIQIESFRFVFEAIRDRPRFLTVHSRRAESTVVAMLEEYGVRGAVLHWYTGPARIIPRAVHAGCYFSINPAMVRSKSGREAIARLPRNRILLESDGPFVVVESRRSEPRDLHVVVKALAHIWKDSEERVLEILQKNFLECTHCLHGT